MNEHDGNEFDKAIIDNTHSLAEIEARKNLRILLEMKVTNELMANVQKTDFIYLRLIKAGHIITICSEANGGKTTILINAAAHITAKGYEVYYINMDASLSDMEYYQKHADTHKYHLIAPDLQEGKSTDDVLDFFKKAASQNGDYAKVVVIVDTLKKLVNVIQKSEQKNLFKLFRRLSTKGMTIISLAHVNKHRGSDGKLIYEGTADTRNDVDELIYFNPVKNQDGTMTVSAEIDKDRAGAANVTFTIHTDRTVSVEPAYVDTVEILRQKQLRQQDNDLIEFILQEIKVGKKNLTQLHAAAKTREQAYSRQAIESVLNRYIDDGLCKEPLWRWTNGAHNARFYSAID